MSCLLLFNANQCDDMHLFPFLSSSRAAQQKKPHHDLTTVHSLVFHSITYGKVMHSRTCGLHGSGCHIFHVKDPRMYSAVDPHLKMFCAREPHTVQLSHMLVVKTFKMSNFFIFILLYNIF